jgi:hypothetical protein
MSYSSNTAIDFSSNYYTSTAKEYTFQSSPKYVGYYEIGGKYGLRIALANKPSWFNRTMIKLCFGWEWFDSSAI